MKKLILVAPAILLAMVAHTQNVGIGTTTPAFKLDVQGRMRVKTGTTGSLGTAPGIWMDDYRDGTNRFFFGMKDSIRAGFYGSGTGGVGWDFTFNTKNGNIGIGYLDPPYYKLTIDGEVGLYMTSRDATYPYGAITNNSGALQINARTGSLFANTDPKNIILQYITGLGQTSGNVGIGTVAPMAKLHVSGSGELFRTGNATTAIQMANDYLQFVGSGAGKFFMQLSGNHLTLSPSSGNNTGNLILNGNQVTIGQINAANGYKLSVGGKAICEELKVQLQGSWPDYVFNKNYNLKSFDELRTFISQNNHLPNIPAATEVEKNGIEVGDMQKRMMVKIEELTLYILQLEEKITELKKDMAGKN